MKSLLIQARDALIATRPYVGTVYTTASTREATTKAIAALQAAIDAPEPEPFGWAYSEHGAKPILNQHPPCSYDAGQLSENEVTVTPLYTHQPTVREPLSVEKILSMDIRGTKDEALRSN